MSAVLYTLSDPRDLVNPRYVGWTAKETGRRLAQHLTEARGKGHNHRLHWLRDLLGESLLPTMRTVAILETSEEAKRCEVAYIASLRKTGCHLTNGTSGGDGALNLSPEAREKIGAAARGRTYDAEARAVRSVALLGRKGPPRNASWRAKHAEAARGKRPSVETREKMSEAQRNRKRGPHSAETRAKIAESHRGKTHGAETRAKLAKSARAWWLEKRAAV